MTKKEMFNLIASVNADNSEIVDFCQHEIQLLESRKNNSKGLTKTQKANEGVKDLILAALADTEGMTVTEILGCEGLEEYTNQKISALLRQLKDAGKVVKTIEGKKAFFALAQS